jgi:hypothetical protein
MSNDEEAPTGLTRLSLEAGKEGPSTSAAFSPHSTARSAVATGHICRSGDTPSMLSSSRAWQSTTEIST